MKTSIFNTKVKLLPFIIRSVSILIFLLFLQPLNAQDDVPSKAEFMKLFTKKWSLTEATLNDNSVPRQYFEGSWIDMEEDGTYTYLEPSKSQEILKGTWKYFERTKLVVVESDDQIQQWQIKGISNDELFIHLAHPQGAMKVTFTRVN